VTRATSTSTAASLPAAQRSEILALLPGDWASIALVDAHYRACNALGLLPNEASEMGHHVGRRLQGPFADVLTKTVRGVGVTPWVLLDQLHRFWGRVIRGGNAVATRVGPKDALICAEGFEPFQYDYCRYAYGGMFSLGFQLAGARALTFHTGTYDRTLMSCTYRASWV
jgi:hypothetical protein